MNRRSAAIQVLEGITNSRHRTGDGDGCQEKLLLFCLQGPSNNTQAMLSLYHLSLQVRITYGSGCLRCEGNWWDSVNGWYKKRLAGVLVDKYLSRNSQS